MLFRTLLVVVSLSPIFSYVFAEVKSEPQIENKPSDLQETIKQVINGDGGGISEISKTNLKAIEMATGILDGDSPRNNTKLRFGELDTESKIYKTNMKELLNKVDQTINQHKRGEGHIESMRVTGIADKDEAEIRFAILDSMGINRGISGYIFVSESMPESLIRAYSIDAERLGFTLVFRGFAQKNGVPEKLASFLGKYHSRSKGMAVQIDPRLFDAFNIQHVPSFVISEVPSLDACDDGPIKSIQYNNKDYNYKSCKEISSDLYCKMNGSVYTGWAIQHMSRSGCDIAASFLAQFEEDPDFSQRRVSNADWDNHTPLFMDSSEDETGNFKRMSEMLEGDFTR